MGLVTSGLFDRTTHDRYIYSEGSNAEFSTEDRAVLVTALYCSNDDERAVELYGSDRHIYRIRPKKVECDSIVVLHYIGEDGICTEHPYSRRWVWEVIDNAEEENEKS